MCTGDKRGQRRELDILELQLQVAVSNLIKGAGNRTLGSLEEQQDFQLESFDGLHLIQNKDGSPLLQKHQDST